MKNPQDTKTSEVKVTPTTGKPKSVLIIFLWLLSAILFTALGAAGYWYYAKTKDNEQIDTQTGSEETEVKEELPTTSLVEVNYIRYTEFPNYEYFTFQTKYPSNYIVISDDMQTDYNSRGGVAAALLTFYKPESLNQLDKHTENNEIIIKSADEIISIESWAYAEWYDEKVTFDKETTAKYNKFEFVIKEGIVTKNNENIKIKVAFVRTGKADYYFQATGDTINDLDILLQNFDILQASLERDGITL